MAYNKNPFITSSNYTVHVVSGTCGIEIEIKTAKANKNSPFVLEKFSRVLFIIKFEVRTKW